MQQQQKIVVDQQLKTHRVGTFNRGQMVPEFDAVCFDDTVPLNEVVGPVKTQFGVHLIKVGARSASAEDSAD